MTVIEYAEKRLKECEAHDKAYWAAYLDGARAQKKESRESHTQLLETTEILYMEAEKDSEGGRS